ncbi:MAG: zinc ribbon domain-containing protein [Clostridia bacterium]|nr:zinc ribbon domain-containing protein [Clostridia bacterium]
MVKCPNCSKELPDGSSFCLYCCTSTVDRKLFSVSEEGGFSSFIKSRQLRVAVSCLLIVGLAFGGGMLFKKYNHGIVSVSAENTTLIPVTNENGEAVTDSSGEAVMELAVPVTDKNGEELTGVDGEKLYQSVVPVTDAQGEIVTAKGGEQVYQVASGSTENATEEQTAKKSLLNIIFGGGDKKESSTAAQTTAKSVQSTTRPSTPSTTAKPVSTTAKPTTTAVQAVSEVPSAEEFSYREVNGKILITSYNGKKSHVIVPTHINSKEVAYIGVGAFSNNSFIEKITFESINSGYGRNLFFQAGGAVFNNLKNLKEIHFAYETSYRTVDSDCNVISTNSLENIPKLFNAVPRLSTFTQDPQSINPENALHASGIRLVVENNLLFNLPTLLYCPPAYPSTVLDLKAELPSLAYSSVKNCTAAVNGAFKDLVNVRKIVLSKNYSYNYLSPFVGSLSSSVEELAVEQGNDRLFSSGGVLYTVGSAVNGVQYYRIAAYPAGKKDASYTLPDNGLAYLVTGDRFNSNVYLRTLTVPYGVVSEDLFTNSQRPSALTKVRLRDTLKYPYGDTNAAAAKKHSVSFELY